MEIHETVMAEKAIDRMHIKKLDKYIDATLGTGGHTEEIIKRGGEVLGIEIDSEILKIAQERLKNAHPTPKLVQGNFINIDRIARENGFDKVSGIIFDLGVSNLHLKASDRGFSFSESQATLDMRLNKEEQGLRACDLLNALRQDQLIKLFSEVMDFSSSRWLAKKVVDVRKMRKLETVGDLLEITDQLKGTKPGLSRATLPFLALRIAVNSELDNLREVLPKAYRLLGKDGMMAVITFHSGEDKIVKEFAGGGEFEISEATEIEKNPKARSAKLRVIIKK